MIGLSVDGRVTLPEAITEDLTGVLKDIPTKVFSRLESLPKDELLRYIKKQSGTIKTLTDQLEELKKHPKSDGEGSPGSVDSLNPPENSGPCPECSSIKAQLASELQKSASLQMERAVLLEEQEQFKSTLEANVQSTINQLEAEKASMEGECQRLLSEVKDLRSITEQFQSQIQVLEGSLGDAVKRSSDLASELYVQQGLARQQAEMLLEAEKHHALLRSSLETELKVTKEKVDWLQRQSRPLVTSAADSMQQRVLKRSSSFSQESVNGGIGSLCEELQKENEELHEKIKSTKNGSLLLAEMNKKLQSDYDKLMEERKQLKSRVDQISGERDLVTGQFQSLHEMVLSLPAKLSFAVQPTVDLYKGESLKDMAACLETSNQNDLSKEDLLQKFTSCQNLIKGLLYAHGNLSDELTEAHNEQGILRNNISEMNQSLNNLNAQMMSLQVVSENSKVQVQELQLALSQACKVNSELTGTVERLNEEKLTLECEVDELFDARDELQHRLSECLQAITAASGSSSPTPGVASRDREHHEQSCMKNIIRSLEVQLKLLEEEKAFLLQEKSCYHEYSQNSSKPNQDQLSDQLFELRDRLEKLTAEKALHDQEKQMMESEKAQLELRLLAAEKDLEEITSSQLRENQDAPQTKVECPGGIPSWNQEKEALEARILELNGMLDQLQHQVQTLSASNLHLHDERQLAESQKFDLESTLCELEVVRQGLSADKLLLMEEKQALESSKWDLEEELCSLSKQLETSAEEKVLSCQEKQQANEIISDLQSQLSGMEGDLRRLTEEKLQQGLDLKTLESFKFESEGKIQKLEDTLKVVSEKNLAQQQAAVMAESIQAELSAKLEHILEANMNEKLLHEQERDTLLRINSNLESELLEAKGRFQKVLEENSRLDEAKQLGDTQSSNLQNIVDGLKSHIENLNKEKTELEHKMVKLKVALKKIVEEKTQLGKDVASLNETVKILTDEKTRCEECVKSKEEFLLRAAEDKAGFESCLSACRAELETLRQAQVTMLKEKTVLEERLKVSVKSESALLLKLTEADSTIKKLCSTTEDLQRDLSQKKTQLTAVQSEKDKVIGEIEEERRMLTMVRLEMEGYDRTVQALTSHLDLRVQEEAVLRNQLEEKQRAVQQLEASIGSAESKEAESEKRLNKLKIVVVKLKKDLTEAKSKEQNWAESVKVLEHKVEVQASQIEDLKIEATGLTSRCSAVNEELSAERRTHRDIVSSLNARVLALEKEQETTQSAMADLQAEFSSYKTRAQTILRQHKEQQVNTLKTETDDRKALEILMKELKMEVEAKERKCEELRSLVTELESCNAALLDSQNQLRLEMEAVVAACEERVEKLQKDSTRLQADSVSACERLSLKNRELTVEHQLRLDQMSAEHRYQVMQLEEKVARLTVMTAENLSADAGPMSRQNLPSSQVEFQHHSSLDQQGLGSEVPMAELYESLDVEQGRVSPAPSWGVNSSLALERLLSTDMDSFHTSGPSQSDIDTLRGRLALSEKNVDHLTEVLRETESNAARLNELVRVLKEEIRRAERNIEREETISNMEYLKNVIIQFISSAVPDRQQLVPVLVTLLKLNSAEKELLNRVAQNDRGSQSSSWSSYLRWT